MGEFKECSFMYLFYYCSKHKKSLSRNEFEFFSNLGKYESSTILYKSLYIICDKDL